MKGGTRKGAGRPPGSKKANPKSEQIAYRVTLEERAAIEEAASVSGMTVSWFSAAAVIVMAEKINKKK